MKTSLILSILILIGAAFVATWQKGESGDLDKEYEALRAEVASLGVDPQSLAAERESLSQMSLKQVLARVDAIDTKSARDARTRAFAATISEFAAEQKKREHQGPPDAETQARIMEVMEGLLELKGDDFKVLLEAFRGDSSLTGDMRQELVGMAVMMLGQQSPQSALDLLASSKEELIKGGRSGFMVGMCLQGLAQKDPAGALAWMDNHKDLVDEQAMRQTLQGVAAKDPELAMRRVLNRKEEGGGDIASVAGGMGSMATDAASRAALLEAMRKTTAAAATTTGEEGAGVQEDEAAKKARQLRDVVLTSVGARLGQGSFEESKTWLESGAVSGEEKAKIMDGIASSLYGKDPAQWLDWMSSNLPEEKMSAKLQAIIPNWTRQDFNAVGAWLNGQPAGKPKETATLSFAETLIPHEPEAAQRWLESLPDSTRKADLLKKIADAPAPPQQGDNSQNPQEPGSAESLPPAPAPAPAEER